MNVWEKITIKNNLQSIYWKKFPIKNKFRLNVWEKISNKEINLQSIYGKTFQ
jgi:hypothetical protein